MSLYPLRSLSQVRPVANADYFLSNRYLAWFTQTILQIIPLPNVLRKKHDPLAEVANSIANNAIIIYYPEGTRGKPEQMGTFKKGIARLAERFPAVPIVPIYLQGLGKVLPKGERLFVPFNIHVVIGEPIKREQDNNDFLTRLATQITSLASELPCLNH